MEKERKKLFSYDELKQIFILMTRPDCRRNALILEFLFLTGLRYGELASLKWEDYDKQAAYIDINSTLDYSVGGVTKNAIQHQKQLLLIGKFTCLIDQSRFLLILKVIIRDCYKMVEVL